jgi:hypothetical protein
MNPSSGSALFASMLYGVSSILQATASRRVARTEGLDPGVDQAGLHCLSGRREKAEDA